MKRGAFEEDHPVSRVVYHFHDPLKPDNLAGFFKPSLFPVPFLSSLSWVLLKEGGQNNHPLGGSRNMSWNDARLYLLDALTNPTNEQRQASFAQTFQALGHVMHLIQDAANPAHVRNDSHLCILVFCKDVDFLHRWAEQHPEEVSNTISDHGIILPDAHTLR